MSTWQQNREWQLKSMKRPGKKCKKNQTEKLKCFWVSLMIFYGDFVGNLKTSLFFNRSFKYCWKKKMSDHERVATDTINSKLWNWGNRKV
jgi:hypothetical protein